MLMFLGYIETHFTNEVTGYGSPDLVDSDAVDIITRTRFQLSYNAESLIIVFA